MAMRVISRFYLTYPDAVQAMADLAADGVADSDVSLIESEDDARLPAEVLDDAAQSPAGTGAKLGAAIGGGVGALLGIGAFSLPLLDPVVQLGWFVPTVIGAVCGGGLGALFGVVTRLGVSSPQAHSFAEGLQRGEHLLMVRVEEGRFAQVEAILARTYAPLPEVEAPDGPEQSAQQTLEAIHRDEKRIQYTSE